MSEPVHLCVLCAIRPAVDREHVPAKGLFPKPCPPDLNLITVPACAECNGGSKLDDEYVRSYFALRIEEAPSEALAKMREAAERAFTNPKGRGLQETFARALTLDWVPDGDGHVLTLQNRITPDLRRVGRVLLKHTRGVFYHATGRILPAGAKLLVMPDYKIKQLSAARQRGFESWLKRSLAGMCGQVGEVFSYGLCLRNDGQNSFAMSLLYYRTFLYMVMTPSQTFRAGPLSDSWDHGARGLPR